MDKILIVDDEVQIRKHLTRLMELEGYEVLSAADCKSALKLLEFHALDVVICDVFLPDGNGIELDANLHKILWILYSCNKNQDHLAQISH